MSVRFFPCIFGKSLLKYSVVLKINKGLDPENQQKRQNLLKKVDSEFP